MLVVYKQLHKIYKELLYEKCFYIRLIKQISTMLSLIQSPEL